MADLRSRTVFRRFRFWVGSGLLVLAWLVGMLAAHVMGEGNLDD